MTLNERTDNGVPRLPSGLSRNTGTVRDGGVSSGEGHGSPQGSGRGRALAWGAGYCFAAGLCALWATPLVALLGGYGVAQACARGGRRERLVCALCLVLSCLVSGCVAGALFGFSAGVSGLLSGLVPSLVALFVGLGVSSDRQSFELLAACVVGAGVLFAGADQYDALMQGTTIAAQFTAALDGLASSATSLSQTAAWRGILPLLATLWPAYYVGEGFVEVIVAHIGARMALRREQVQTSPAHRLAAYDLPLWVLSVLLGGIVCLIVAGIIPVGAGVFRALGCNVIMIVRYAFAAQGFAVLEWVFDEHGTRTPLRVLAIVGLAYAELLFFVMTVVGIIDVWANFRHLGRGSVQPSQGGDDREV